MEDKFLRYFDPELSESERKELILEIMGDKEKRHNFEQLVKTWSFSALGNSSNDDLNISQEYSRLISQLEHNNEKKKGEILVPLRLILRYAAVFLVLIGLGFGGYFYFKPQEQIAYNEVTTKTGEKAQIKLSDGTTIWLNASSKLRYPDKLNNKKVDVYLQGEAYFDVTHLGNRLFQVHTSNLNIKVLGTAFNVKSYPEEKVTETTLVRGKVRIEGKSANSEDFVILHPNQKATYLGSRSKLVVTQSESKNTQDRSDDLPKLKEIASKTNATVVLSNNVNTKFETSWKDGRLEFVDEQFSSLAIKMERWFGVKIRITDDRLEKVRYTGIFEKESIDQALQALSLSLPFKYIISKDSIIIKK